MLPPWQYAENVTVTEDRAPDRAEMPRAYGWSLRGLARAADDVGAWLLALVLVSFIGFGYFMVDLHDRNQARELQVNGEWVVATDVQVHIHHVGGRGGNYDEVDKVRVRIDGAPAPVALDNVNSAAEAASLDPDTPDGWQPATSAAGYEGPLQVRVHRDGDGTVLSAMASDDYEYWTQDNDDPEFSLIFGAPVLGLAALLLLANTARLDRRERLRASGHWPNKRQQALAQNRADRVARTGRRGSA